jgi:hypothetical protein
MPKILLQHNLPKADQFSSQQPSSCDLAWRS